MTDDNKAEYDALVSNYEGMKYELANLMAYSANNDNEAAYALANGKIADYSSAMQESIAAIRTNVSENADVAKEQLAAVYRTSIAASTASIIISVAALLATLICVFRLAAKLGVSRTPIRESIRMLEQEGLAVTIPRKGAEVARL